MNFRTDFDDIILPLKISDEQQKIIDKIPSKEEDEIFLPIQCDYNNYYISSEGRIWNQEYNRYVKGTLDKKIRYIRVKLSKNKISISFLMHRLVAQHFYLNPDKKTDVNHINGIRHDNRLINLEWTTHQENCQHASDNLTEHAKISVQRLHPVTYDVIETYPSMAHVEGFTPQGISNAIRFEQKHYGFYWKYTEEKSEEYIEGEIWYNCKDSIFDEVKIFPNYKVSDHGRIKGFYNQIMKPTPYTINLSNGDIIQPFFVHRLVIMACNVQNKENKPEVDHIDSDYTNNKLINLRWATRTEQMQNPETIKKLIGPNTKKYLTIKVTKNGEEKIYYGRDNLSAEININRATISKYIKSGEEFRGYKFELIY